MRKNTLFIQIYSAFIISIIIFSLILLIVYNRGLSKAISNWENDSIKELKNIAIEVIENPENIIGINIPSDKSVFIYDINKSLIYSNRGMGRQNAQRRDLIPLYSNKILLGYLYTSDLHFMDNYANKQFSTTITNAIITAITISFILVIIWALVISKGITKPAREIASFVKRLAKGDIGRTIPENGALEIREIANSVNNLSNQLSREKDLRTQWTRDISHDLRTPVAALKAQFEGMSCKVLDISAERIEQNLKEITRMELLIEDLSELMKLEEPKIGIISTEIDVEDFINQFIYHCSKDIKEKNINLVIDSTITTFTGDEGFLYRAFSNIFSNNVRHTGANGEIKITVKQNDNKNIFTIQNNGDIIPENELPLIFDRLFRGETARKTPGSGLGLTISKKIIELHNGNISVQSDMENGTVFTITLPQ